MKIYYTYLYLREDGTPYYVGKGSGARAFKWHRTGCPPKNRILIQEFPSEMDAFEAEKFFISFYGREDLGTGCLLNLTDGGENPPLAFGNQINKGRVQTPEEKEKKSMALKRLWADGTYKGCTGKKFSAETKRKMSQSVDREACGNRFRGKPWSDARRAACVSS